MNWFKESISGRDGQASFQRLTIFIFTVMFVVTWFFQLFFGFFLDSITLIVIACVVSEVDGHLFCGKSSIHNPPINLSSPERRKMRDRAEAEAVALSKLKKQNKL